MGLLAMAFGENYRYHDSPEGEDCFDKLFFMTKYAAAYGVLWSSVDVMLFSHPVGYGPTLARYGTVSLPIIGMAAAWTCTVCAATNIRKKDDQINYAIGGLAAGALFGAARKSLKVGAYTAVGAAFLSSLKKDSDMHGWNILKTDSKPAINTPWTVHRDHSLTKDLPPTLATNYP